MARCCARSARPGRRDQRALAARASVDQSVVSRLETGLQGDYRLGAVYAVAEALGTTLDAAVPPSRGSERSSFCPSPAVLLYRPRYRQSTSTAWASSSPRTSRLSACPWASFIPPAPIRELRELTRYRKTLVQTRTADVNRVQKVLESANLKLAAVASDVMGASGRDMLAALIAGEQDPRCWRTSRGGSCAPSCRPSPRRALDGRVKPHHLVLLECLLTHIASLEQLIAQVQEEIERALAPFAEALALLDGIPGVGPTAAAALVAEIGVDASRFPFGPASGLLGRRLSRQQAERRQAAHGPDDQRQPLVARRPGRGRASHLTVSGHLPPRAVSPPRAPPREAQSADGCRPQRAGDRLSHPEGQAALQRLGRCSLPTSPNGFWAW